jgi:Zinc finger, C3HC4 type (RING finger)
MSPRVTSKRRYRGKSCVGKRRKLDVCPASDCTKSDPDLGGEPKCVDDTAEACQAIAHEFTCVCCMDVMTQATALVPCGHTFCNVCVFYDPPQSRLEKCPTCREVIKFTVPNRAVNNALQAMTKKSTQFFSAEDKMSYQDRIAVALPELTLSSFDSESTDRLTIPESGANSPDPGGSTRELQQEVRWLIEDQQRTVQELRQQLQRRVSELRQQVQEVSDLHDRVRERGSVVREIPFVSNAEPFLDEEPTRPFLRSRRALGRSEDDGTISTLSLSSPLLTRSRRRELENVPSPRVTRSRLR